MIIAMGDNLIGQVFDQIQQRFSDAWNWLCDPLWAWYVGFGLLVLVCLIIAVFVPFKYVRLALGMVIAFGAAFVAGGRQMSKHYKDRLATEREKVKKLEAEKRQRPEQGGNASGGGWPWQW